MADAWWHEGSSQSAASGGEDWSVLSLRRCRESVLLVCWEVMYPRCFRELSARRLRGPHAGRLIWSPSYLAWNIGRSELQDVCWPRRRCPHESPWHPTWWLIIALLKKALCAWAIDGWRALLRLPHVLWYHNGWQLVLARGLPWPAIRPIVVAGRSPSGRVTRERGSLDKFCKEIGIMTGHIHVRHDCCVRVFCGRVMVSDGQISKV